MDKTILFKMPYGIYLVSADMGGCIVNTVSQITDELLTLSINKNSHTANLINDKKRCIISYFSKKASMDIIDHFSFTTGYKVDKFKGFEHQTIENIPYIAKDVVCNILCDVVDIIDADTHYIFLLKFVNIFNVNEKEELMTYEDYRRLKPKMSWACSVCHYVYDSRVPFEEQPDNYICPICGKPKSVFTKIN